MMNKHDAESRSSCVCFGSEIGPNRRPNPVNWAHLCHRAPATLSQCRLTLGALGPRFGPKLTRVGRGWADSATVALCLTQCWHSSAKSSWGVAVEEDVSHWTRNCADEETRVVSGIYLLAIPRQPLCPHFRVVFCRDDVPPFLDLCWMARWRAGGRLWTPIIGFFLSKRAGSTAVAYDKTQPFCFRVWADRLDA